MTQQPEVQLSTCAAMARAGVAKSGRGVLLYNTFDQVQIYISLKSWDKEPVPGYEKDTEIRHAIEHYDIVREYILMLVVRAQDDPVYADIAWYLVAYPPDQAAVLTI